MRRDLHWIEQFRHGRVSIASRPRGGEFLNDDLRLWQADGVRVVVSTLTFQELREFDLTAEEEACTATGLEYVAFPIVDRGVPESASDMLCLVNRLAASVRQEKAVTIHCRMGIGRSSLVAACLLSRFGVDPDTAFSWLSEARGFDVPDTPGQVEWVRRFVGEFSFMQGGGNTAD